MPLSSQTYHRQDYIHTIKDAPKEVTRLNDSLSVIAAVLERLKYDAYEYQDDRFLRDALRSCESCAQEISKAVEELTTTSISNGKLQRVMASFRLANQEKNLAKLEGRLEKAKTTLISAQLIVQRWVLGRHVTRLCVAWQRAVKY